MKYNLFFASPTEDDDVHPQKPTEEKHEDLIPAPELSHEEDHDDHQDAKQSSTSKEVFYQSSDNLIISL